MAVAITNTPVTALNTAATLTRNVATATAVDTAEAFTYTPTAATRQNKTLFAIRNTSSANGTLSYSVAAGAGVFKAAAAKTGTVTQGATAVIELEDGRYAGSNNKIVVTLTPASGKILLTDHAAEMWVVEMI